MDVVRQAIAGLNHAAGLAGHDTEDGRALVEAARSLQHHIVSKQQRHATRHLLGDNEDPIQSVPDMQRISHRVRTAALTAGDRKAITEEAGAATNSHKLDLKGTHYEQGDAFDLEWWLGI